MSEGIEHRDFRRGQRACGKRLGELRARRMQALCRCRPVGGDLQVHTALNDRELGADGAELAIIQGCVHLQITTDGPASTQRLHAARAELAEALAARALPAAEIAVFDAL